MLIPLYFVVVVGHLDKANASLGEATREQTHPAKVRRTGIIHPIQLQGRRRLSRQIFDLRNRGLHAKGKFERVDPCLQRGIATALPEMPAIHRIQPIELQLLDVPRQFRVLNEFHLRFFRWHARVAQRRSVVNGWQERRTPIVDTAECERRADRDESRQVRIFGTKAVADPRADAWPDEVVAAGVQLHHRSAVGRVGAVTRMHHTEVIDTRGDVREQLADPQTALAMLPELPRRTEQVFG